MGTRITRILSLLLLVLAATVAVAQTRRMTLDIYVVDVEGGNAVLFVTPSGESVLIDSGNGGAAAVRDAERILAAAKAEIEQEVHRAKESLRAQVSELAVAGAEKILKREVDARAHADLLSALEKQL